MRPKGVIVGMVTVLELSAVIILCRNVSKEVFTYYRLLLYISITLLVI